MSVPRPPRLAVETREFAHVEDLIPFADATDPLVWLRRGDGLVGVGSPVWTMDAAPQAEGIASAWRAVAAAAEVDDPVGLPGTGLVAFGALDFADPESRRGTFVVPPIIVGRRGDRAWLTRIRLVGDAAPPAPEPTAFGPYWPGALGPGSLDPEGYQSVVRAALDEIRTGLVQKVVLARDLRGTVPVDADLRRLVRALATDYPDTWTYAVGGMIGASPETLVTVSNGRVTARVLAGTIARGADATEDAAASLALATSAKDIEEHRFAVRSVLETLAPHTSDLRADDAPFTLELPNLWHLATDVDGEIADHASALDLVAALHPTAAVAGTPTDRALDLIARLEPFDRGRYAGPVGWVDGDGDGEWAIALRCVQVDAPHNGARAVTAYAGAGIVAGSDPEKELLETRVKFRPIVDAIA